MKTSATINQQMRVTPTVRFTEQNQTLTQALSPANEVSPFLPQSTTPILKNTRKTSKSVKNSNNNSNYEDMEMSENYQAPKIDESIDYTINYNLHQMQSKLQSPLISKSKQLLDESLSTSMLKSQMTINLNTFNQQKRIQRLLQSCSTKPLSTQPRQFKEDTHKDTLNSLINFEISLLDEQTLKTLQLENKTFQAEISQLKSLNEDLDNYLSNFDFNEIPLENLVKTGKIIRTTPQNYKKQPFPSCFKKTIENKNIILTYNINNISIFKLTINTSFRTISTSVFNVLISFNPIFDSILPQLLKIIPENYRFSLQQPNITNQIQIFTPFFSYNSIKTDQVFDLGDFLLTDFNAFLTVLTVNMTHFKEFVLGLKENCSVICYFQEGEICLRGSGKQILIQDIVGMVGFDDGCFYYGVQDLFKALSG